MSLQKGETVQIFIYNLNKLNIGIEVWHSSVVVFGKEFSFGPNGGITKTKPQTPLKVYDVGVTIVSEKQLEIFLEGLEDEFNASTYHVGKNNCNSFSSVLCHYLCDDPTFPDCLGAHKILEKKYGNAVESSRQMSATSTSSFKSSWSS
jgi:hypothetical protein